MDSTKRFSDRAEGYVQFRPGYPASIVDYLQDEYALTTGKVIADIGAGTGISTALFLHAGYEVFAVEPNEPMMNKAIELLAQFPGFHAIPGTAENTLLEAGSIDLVVAGQAFHWFQKEKCKEEFKRILKDDGVVALFWNERRVHTPFEKDYEALIAKYARKNMRVDHRDTDLEKIAEFFAPYPVDLQLFPNEQVFNFDGLKGRLLSSSYMPLAGEEGYDAMITALQQLYEQYRQNDTIIINYDTKLYSGRLK
ncbi:MAG: class I SAM-dependent methyltransferase [Chitinophagaceae bacterium]